MMSGSSNRLVRPIIYNPWAGNLTPAEEWLGQLPRMDIAPLTANPRDAKLQQLGRMDCDWQGECTRCFSRMQAPGITFLPALVLGRNGVGDLLPLARPSEEEWWYVTYAQHPKFLGKLAGAVFAALKKKGIQILYYAYDEASRAMPCFEEIAPSLSVLIHDEKPLSPSGLKQLQQGCLVTCRSWVANVLPFEASFNETPEEKILFLGSEMGLTPHRRRQIDFLKERFKDRFVPSHDHSVPVSDRFELNRFKVSLCPEGRKFCAPAMSASHTDRPFWSGCLGLVPVSENSTQGDRLGQLARENLILRYDHGDLKQLALACEQALSLGVEERRRIHAHFNRHETVGSVVAEHIARFSQ